MYLAHNDCNKGNNYSIQCHTVSNVELGGWTGDDLILTTVNNATLQRVSWSRNDCNFSNLKLTYDEAKEDAKSWINYYISQNQKIVDEYKAKLAEFEESYP